LDVEVQLLLEVSPNQAIQGAKYYNSPHHSTAAS
jgi:hypothetical protein